MESPTTSGLSARRSDLLSILLSLGFFATAVFQGAIPVLGTELRDVYGLSSARVGLLMSAYLIAYAAVQVPAGVLASRAAGKVLAAGFAAMVAGALLFVAVGSYPWFFLARFIQGLGSGAMLPAAGYLLARHLSWNRLGRGWAIYGGFGSVGYVVVLLGLSRLVERGGTEAFFVTAALIAAAAGVATFATRGLVRERPTDNDPPAASSVARDLLSLVRSRTVTLLGLVNVAGVAISVSVMTWTPAYLQDDFSASLGFAATVTAGFAAAQIVGAPLAAVMLARFGHLPMLVGVFTVMSSVLLVFAFLDDVPKIFVAELLVGVCASLAFAPSFSIIPMLVEVRLVGVAGGYLNAFGFVGALTAPWIFGVFLDAGLPYAAGYLMLAGFGAAGAASAVALFFTVRGGLVRVGAIH